MYPNSVSILPQLEDVTLVYLKALEVKQALWVNSCGRRIKVMDEGYLWIDVCEPHQNYVVTIHCDNEQKIVQWYIDSVKWWRFDDAGFPYYDDLYLDIVRLPEGATQTLDWDELSYALESSKLKEEDFTLARRTAKKLETALLQGTFEPIVKAPLYISKFRDYDKVN